VSVGSHDVATTIQIIVSRCHAGLSDLLAY
jgi:hypothetical protein